MEQLELTRMLGERPAMTLRSMAVKAKADPKDLPSQDLDGAHSQEEMGTLMAATLRSTTPR